MNIKKRKLKYSLLLFLLGAVYFCSACTSSGIVLEKVPEMKMGMALYRKEDTFISMIVEDLTGWAKKMEVSENIKVTLDVVDGKGNQMIQNEQIDKFIEQEYDVICVNIVDRTVASTIIDKAKAANIPLVFFNREPVKEDLERWNKAYYVGALARESGIMQGNLVVDEYKKNPEKFDKNEDGKLQYVMLEGEQGHQDSLLRTEYSIKAITGAGIEVDKIANDAANWLRSQAYTKMNQWIEQYGDSIELVLCNNDDMALGAIDAYEMEHKGQKLPMIVGIDGTDLAIQKIKEGKLLGTIKNDSKKQSKAIFDISYGLRFNKEFAKKVNLQNDIYVFVGYQFVQLPKEEQEE